ncbi:MSMEG_0570 family nitrogen starvation response protein [Rhodobacterales bacterium]|nr:MSMEG_0570 family nitrogen starvation response protein [Rhodobacterales bacterium]
MPDLTFRIRWPDGGEERCYSPSTIVTQFFTEGETYPLAGFLKLCDEAFTAASDRVRAVHGFPCSHAASQLAAIKKSAAPFHAQSDATVTFLRFETGAERRISQ